MRNYRTLFTLAVLTISLLFIATLSGTSSDIAVERARTLVRMLDDIYKAMVVLITENYVQNEKDFPAGSAAIALFEVVKAKGWHEVRLLDLSGQPQNSANAPQDDFEREAAEQLKTGLEYVDRVEFIDGIRYLRAATGIPLVMPKCTVCHANYRDVAAGKPVGMLSYKVPIK